MVIVKRIAKLIKELGKDYSFDNCDEYVEKLLNNIVDIFCLKNMVVVDREYAENGKFPISDEKEAPIYSYIPDDFEEQEHIIKWIQISAKFISTYREIQGYKIPDVQIDLINDGSGNAYSSGTKDEGYHICFPIGIIRKINEMVSEYETESSDVLKLQEKLLFFTIGFITMHEYAHILNGDCDRTRYLKEHPEIKKTIDLKAERVRQESEADKRAKNILYNMIPFMHRMKKVPEDEIQLEVMKFMGKIGADYKFLNEAIGIVERYRNS